MKRILVVASMSIGFAFASCGNQNGTSTNNPTPADSAVSNGTEGQNPTDTGMGTINNGTPNNNMDTTNNGDSSQQH